MSYMDEIAHQHYASLPLGWSTSRAKFVADVQTSNVDKVASPDEIPVRLCNYTDVYYRDRITADLQLMEGTATKTEIEKFKLRAGQVLITKDSESWDDIGIPALVVEDIPDAVCGYHLAIFTPQTGSLDGAYLAWLCRADSLNDQFKLSANGVTRFGLGQYAMKNAVMAVPPLATQRRIAVFLDQKTAQLDALIEKKQQVLERLAEKRQAIITQAVTKGVNPFATMKDSGIDWLGQIPVNWRALPLKRMKKYLTSGSRDWAEYYSDEGDNFLRMTNVTKGGVEIDGTDLRKVKLDGVFEGTRTATRTGDILITITAELGSVAIVSPEYEGSYINQHLALFRCDREQCDPEFLVNFLWSDVTKTQFVLSGQGGTKQGLGFDQVDTVVIALPPLKEQSQIAGFVKAQHQRIDALEGAVRTSQQGLMEYRSALITAAVTGQIETLR